MVIMVTNAIRPVPSRPFPPAPSGALLSLPYYYYPHITHTHIHNVYQISDFVLAAMSLLRPAGAAQSRIVIDSATFNIYAGFEKHGENLSRIQSEGALEGT